MAAIANTAAELRVSNHVWEKEKNVTGLFQTSGADDICAAGFLVKRGALLPNEGYTGIKNENAWYMNAATADDATDEIYFCNTFGVQELADAQGNTYKIGRDTLGLAIPAGQRGTYTRVDGIQSHDIIRFGAGNFSSTPTVGQFATIANGLLAPAASAPTTAGTLYFEVLSTGVFTVGAYAGPTYYEVRAKRVLG